MSTPEILLLYTEKQQYTNSDIVKISGLVSSLDSPTVLIGIHDPFGMPVGFYFGNVNSDLEFSTSFLVKDGVNFRTEGMYSVKAHYAESETVSFFEYSKVSQETIPDEEIVDDTHDESLDENIVDKSSDENISNVGNSSDEEI